MQMQIILRTSAVHDWFINNAWTMKTNFVYDKHDLDILRNVRGNGGNIAGQLIRRNLRDQHDDVDYLTVQNALNWAISTDNIKY